MVDELKEKCPAFRAAYDEDGLTVDEFATFGPVNLFRSMFCDGWSKLVDVIGTRRSKV
jgi:hypothetical protein